MTHPVVDLSGYITEGQISWTGTFTIAGIYPPVSLPSLSRPMNNGDRKGAYVPGTDRADQVIVPHYAVTGTRAPS